jgi:hypothetical protein
MNRRTGDIAPRGPRWTVSREVQEERHSEAYLQEPEKVQAEIERAYHLHQDVKLTPESLARFFRQKNP